jgi:hypothetical protein
LSRFHNSPNPHRSISSQKDLLLASLAGCFRFGHNRTEPGSRRLRFLRRSAMPAQHLGTGTPRDHQAENLGRSWLSRTVCGGLPAGFLFCRPSTNHLSSAISLGLLCLPPLWISSSRCIKSAKLSMTTSSAFAENAKKYSPSRTVQNCTVSSVCPMLAFAQSDPSRKGWHLRASSLFLAPRRHERRAKHRAGSGFCGITTRVTENSHPAASPNAASGGNLGPFRGWRGLKSTSASRGSPL